MVRINENQEAVALIRMAIDDYNRVQSFQADCDESVTKLPKELEFDSLEQHWTFSSPSGTRLDSRELEASFAPTNPDFFSFDQCLRSFITDNFPEEAPRYEDLIYVRPHFMVRALSLSHYI